MWSYKSFSSTWLIQQAKHESVSAQEQKFRVHTARSQSRSALQGSLHCPICTMVMLWFAIKKKEKKKKEWNVRKPYPWCQKCGFLYMKVLHKIGKTKPYPHFLSVFVPTACRKRCMWCNLTLWWLKAYTVLDYKIHF